MTNFISFNFRTKFEAIGDDLSAAQVLKQVQGAAKEAAKKLVRKNMANMGFLRQKKDGTTSLNIIVPNDGVDLSTNERPVLLGALIGKLQHGTGQLQGFKEDRRNFVKAGGLNAAIYFELFSLRYF